jgi:hypothetical protein
MMSGTMKEVQVLLYKAKQNGNSELGESEIYSIAFLTKERTNNKFFANAHFGVGYSGITSPEIRNALSLFRRNATASIKFNPVPDIYFEITQTGERKTKPFIDKMRKEGIGWENTIEEILRNLEKDRKEVIREALKRMKN